MKWSGERLRRVPLRETRILELLRREARSVPEMAEALGVSPEEVMLALSGLLRTGKVEPLPKGRRERYFRYRARNA
ncbi:hypothetical protein [Thermosulfurimonas sp. F29]|uniref:hypothetical protein n=1 Tax=Thermosulfurimonas sp. F29 TaxID=2867247 RepID=UPI001C8386FB|nr:hypothetical protein [Thermosulfurimonas sp. F29]MBX6422305.1 hypothetical protein [Thermosulfurimonas sp. F29]